MAIGDITGIASHEWDASQGAYPDIIHIAGNIYAITYFGPGTGGWLKTVSISDDGLTMSNVASLEWAASQWGYPDIIHIAGNIYAIAYTGPGDDGWLKTVSISDDGVTLSSVASLEFDTVHGERPDIIHIAGNIYAIAYTGPGDDGWLKTVSISDDGLTLSTVASHEFAASQGMYPDIIHIAGNIYAIAHSAADFASWIKTVSISDDGLTISAVASHQFDTREVHPDTIHIAGNIYAIVVRDWIKTYSISDDGLTMSSVASHGTSGTIADIIHVVDNVYAIAASGGWLKTVGVSDDGLTMSNVASYQFETGFGYYPRIINVTGDVHAIAYTGPDYDGWLKTVGITTSEALAAAARHRFTGGMMHRPVH